ncbi:unnamed protein product [Litomosoides sigmodontis]|uniref:Uncharacterized protein n=1 Tax=Litomosoides sigmodontis TaxID=42156 RepID=A0A3P7K1K0_LITSI|nr:unnamed protein product [Litomosoides sigmodontis]
MCLTKIGEDKLIRRVKRQCGCCSCYNPGKPCACSSSCACAPYNYPSGYGNTVYTSYNYPAGYGGTVYGGNGITYNAGYSGYGFGYNSPYPYSTHHQYNPPTYGIQYNTGHYNTRNYNKGCGTGNGCGADTNIFPYSFGNGYGGTFATGNTGYIYL